MTSHRDLGRGVSVLAVATLLASCYVPLNGTTSAGPLPPAQVLPAGSGPGGILPAGTLPSGGGSLKPTVASTALGLGEERSMNALLKDGNGLAPTGGVVWLSSNPAIVTVNGTSGQATAKAPGTAILTASLQAAPSVQTQIEVKVSDSQTVKVIRVEPSTPTMAIGDSLKLIPTVELANGKVNANVTWTSDDNTIATVNATTGEVSALKVGETTISAAYAQDTKFVGLSRIKVVAEKSMVPSPKPSQVIFGPGGTQPSDLASSGEPGTVVAGPEGRYVVQSSGTTLALDAVDFLDASTGYAVGRQGTMLKTTNAGAKWETVSPAEFASFSLNGVHFADSTHGFVMHPQGGFRTSDGGETWKAFTFGGEPIGTVRVERALFSDRQNGYIIGSGNLVFKTTDGGLSFEKVVIAATTSIATILVSGGTEVVLDTSGAIFRYDGELGGFDKVLPSAAGGGNGVMGSGGGSTLWYYNTNNQLFKSTNNGVKWINTGPIKFGDSGPANLSGVAIGIYFPTPTDGWIIFQQGIATTHDGGATWKNLDNLTPGGERNIQDVSFPDSRNGWFVGISGRIIRYVQK